MSQSVHTEPLCCVDHEGVTPRQGELRRVGEGRCVQGGRRGEPVSPTEGSVLAKPQKSRVTLLLGPSGPRESPTVQGESCCGLEGQA